MLKFSIFRECIVYVDKWEVISDNTSPIFTFSLDMASLDLRMYGAELVDNYSDRVTHVIYDASFHPQRSLFWKQKLKLRKFHLVSASWVEDSIKKESRVEELEHEI